MEAGLAAMYGNGEGQNVTHYYAGRPDTVPKQKRKKKKVEKAEKRPVLSKCKG